MDKDLIFKELEKGNDSFVRKFSTCKIGHYLIIDLNFLNSHLLKIIKKLILLGEQR